MNKKIILFSFVFVGLVSLVSSVFAQGQPKTPQPTKTVVDPRVITSPTTVVSPPSPTVAVPGTTTTGTTTPVTDPSTPTGVQGTSTTPTVLPTTTQTGGVTNSPSSGDGKKNKKRQQQNSANDVNGHPIVSTPSMSGEGVEVNGIKPAPGSFDWKAPNAKTPTLPTTTSPVACTDQGGCLNDGSAPTVKLSCEDEAVREVYKIMASDQNNAFGKMVELTTMKLARKALETGSATLEGYTRTKILELENYFKKSKSGGEFYAKIQGAYQSMGKSSDAATINKDLDAALAQGKKACYWASATDLDNTHVASYVLAIGAADPKSGLTDGDAATIWALEKIGGGGQLSITNRVARYLGAIQGGKASTKAQLDGAIAAQEKEINSLIASARTKAETSLIACIEQQNPSCSDCQAKAKAKLSASTSTIEQVQKGLALAVKKSQAAQMVSKFKGKAGEIEFDLGNFAQGAVKKDPSRLKGFDACGNAVVPKTASAVPAQDCQCTAQQPSSCNCDPKGPAPFKGAYWSPEKNAWTMAEVGGAPYTSAKNDVACYKLKGCWDGSKKSCGACEAGWSVKLTPKQNEQANYMNWQTTPLTEDAGKIAKNAVLKKALNGTVWPDLCIKYNGCFDMKGKPMCGVCAQGEEPSIKNMPKVSTSAYKLSVKDHVSLNVEGLNIPIYRTHSGLDPQQHPTLNTIDHILPIPLGTFYQMEKDAFTYQAAMTSVGLKIAHAQAEKSIRQASDAVRDPANIAATKKAIKTTGGYIKNTIWYLTPFGKFDYLLDAVTD